MSIQLIILTMTARYRIYYIYNTSTSLTYMEMQYVHIRIVGRLIFSQSVTLCIVTLVMGYISAMRSLAALTKISSSCAASAPIYCRDKPLNSNSRVDLST